MSYKAEIVVSEDPENVEKCFIPEKISRERSIFSLEKGRGFLKIKVDAKDAVALRASLNAITQVLAVYSKAKQVK